ncbi:protein LIAT1 [Anableps anableps]
MAEEMNCNSLLPHKSCAHRKKKKGNKANPKQKEKPESVSPIPELPPQDPGQTQLPKLRAIGKKARDHCSRGAGKTKERQKDSKGHLEAAHTTSDDKVGIEAKESLRWEGVMQDPQEEAKRLERYRANRRQRYITHREALLREAQHALRQAELKTSVN